MRRVLVTTVTLGLLLAACAAERTSQPGNGSRPLLPEDRLALPTFDLPRFRALLGELRGTPVVVNFWGSWCPPCAAEAPGLAAVSSRYDGRVQFVGVDILDARAPARDVILSFDWRYPSVFDPNGAIRDGLGYVGQPITLIYDRSGSLTFEWNGLIDEKLLEREIRKVL
jgi:thiol-disulfide isomerase/thioredoxin